ncbi:PREDICTED: uncharacterized protein LOC108752412 [Trachymyrmex septentrionalis]|uniref:uncharacterized protein LOC108752412 n=1 Tax=Trachymyrmex septentrionalis TaxID=34720 RepID=UPI00084EDA77|nr:PREDICTED: uncharacterized protein LOC108752412 [Trachymyrmex septentrionalis]
MTERTNLQNFNYEDDIRYTIQVHRLIMGLIGVWPNMEKPGKWTRLLRGLLRTACCFLLSFNLIPWVLYMFLILDTFKNRLRMIGGFFFYSMVPAMYFTLMLREDRIKKCMRHLQEDWRNVWDANDRKIMLDQARAGRFVIICTLLFLFTSGFTHRLIKPILRGTIVIGNVSIRPLVQGNYFIFFDPQQSPAYEIVFSMHLVTGIVIYIVTTSVCGITALFTMHACGQLKMLTVWLENTAIENQWSKCAIARRLAAIVMHHGNKVNTTCCTIDWYCLPSKEARYLILVIAMARYPTKLTAGKVIDLSFSSFGAVIRTAMAYLNLLRTVTL